MEDRLWGAGLLVACPAYLGVLFLYSRRIPAPVTFLANLLLSSAGFILLNLSGRIDAAAPAEWAGLLGALAGGAGGGVLSGIDCFRVEAWRQESPRAVVHPVGEARRRQFQALALQIRSGARVVDCPHCDTRVLFPDDLRCPQCGRGLKEDEALS